MNLSPVTAAPAAGEEGQASCAKPARTTPALWVPRVDSLAEFGLMISRQLTQCRRYGGHLSVLWLEAEPANGPVAAVAADESLPGDAGAQADDAAAEVREEADQARAALVTAVGRRLRSRVRGTDLVLQVGESSFAVLLLDAGLSEAHLVHHRLSVALNGPYGVHAHTMHVRLRMGSATFPEGGVRGSDLAESARQDLHRRMV